MRTWGSESLNNKCFALLRQVGYYSRINFWDFVKSFKSCLKFGLP